MTDKIRYRDDVLSPEFKDCFVCGDNNSAGLQLDDLRLVGEIVKATLVPKSQHQGFPGVLHGSIPMAALDEVMGYVSIFLHDIWTATAKIELKYRKPLLIENTYFAEAGLSSPTSNKPKRFHTWAKLTDETGAIYVEANALFLPAPKEMLGMLRASETDSSSDLHQQ